MAEVFRARLDGPMGFQKELAIKRILDSVVREEGGEHVRSLINEARIGGLLKHPNVIEVYELGEEDGSYYIAMELVDGVSLGDVLAEARETGWVLPHNVALDIAIQACRGLAYAHSFQGESRSSHSEPRFQGSGVDEGPGVVHRDMKPSNIMITRGGTAKIMDFGIAKATSNLFDTTATGIAKGTPLYMSPEQLRGMRPLPACSDLFSLGSILYEMVTGKLLFAGRTVPEIITRVLSMPLEDQIHAAEEKLPGIGPILSRLLQRDVAQRFRNAKDAEIELEHLLEWQERRVVTADFVRDFVHGRYSQGESSATTALGLGQEPAGDDQPAPATRPGSETVVARYLAAQRRRRVGIAAALLLLLGGIAAAGYYVYGETLRVALVVDEGREALNRGDLPGALAAWQAAMGENPKRREARFAAAAMISLDDVDEAVVAEVLRSLEGAPEETAEEYERKYRALAWVHRGAMDYRLAMKAQKDAIDRARQAQRNDGAAIPPELLWEAGELTLLREAPDAARAYFRELRDLLPPGGLADAALAFEEAITTGSAPLLRAEILLLGGDPKAWEGLDAALDAAAGSQHRVLDERLLWSFRALGTGRSGLALALLERVEPQTGEVEQKRQIAAVRAAALAGLGRPGEARVHLDAALRACRLEAPSLASRLQVALALARSGADDAWRTDLLVQLARDLGQDDPDVAWLRGPEPWPMAPPPRFARARQLALDPRTGRLLPGGLARGSPGGSPLVPASAFTRINVTDGGLAWPWGPTFHPIDGRPLPVFFHPGR